VPVYSSTAGSVLDGSYIAMFLAAAALPTAAAEIFMWGARFS
jgi:hypothetical protein